MSGLAGYKKDGGYEFDGVTYRDAESLIQEGFFGFCGCGNPDKNLLYILGGLELLNDDNRSDGLVRSDEWLAAHKERVLKHFGSNKAADFFYYWAASVGITDHGDSIPGWLNDAGFKLLEMLREWDGSLKSDTENDR